MVSSIMGKQMNYGVVCTKLLLMILFISGCKSHEPYSSPEIKIAHLFAVALLEGHEDAYHFSSPETHGYVDEWFESTHPIKCGMTEHIGSRSFADTAEDTYMEVDNPISMNFVIRCIKGRPTCTWILFENLTLEPTNNDGLPFVVTHWWDSIEMCDSVEHFNNIVLSDLSYRQPRTFDQ